MKQLQKRPPTIRPALCSLHYWAISVVVVAFLSSGCGSVDREPVSMTDVESEIGPRQESWDADLMISNDGVPRTILRAPIWREYGAEDSTYSVLSSDTDTDTVRVVARIFDEIGAETAVVRADEMQFFDGEGRIEATGNVVVTTSTERILRTEKLIWWEQKAQIVAPGYVSLTAPRETIQGYNLDSDEKLENYTLGRVTGQILVED